MMRYSAVLTLLAVLLSACSEPNPPTIGLYPAIHRGDIDQIKRHIHWDTDMDQVDADGRRPLHVAAERGRYVITQMLVKSGADINAPDRDGHSPLHAALMSGRTQVADLLIKQGSEFDPDQLLRQTVINGVADRDVIDLLLRQGADVNHLGEDGNSPLTLAIGRQQRVLVRLLVSRGADVNKPDASGRYPLQLANEVQDEDIIALLKRNGAGLAPGGAGGS